MIQCKWIYNNKYYLGLHARLSRGAGLLIGAKVLPKVLYLTLLYTHYLFSAGPSKVKY